jgi:GT2 family glycosyltransferase
VIVLDNGSNDGTVHSIRIAYPHVAVIRSESNLGVAGGRNEAAWEAIHRWGVEFLFFMDNDMEIDPACLLELVAAMRGSDRIASATGKIRIVGEARRLYGAGGCLLDFRNGRTGHIAHGELDDGRFDQPGPCLPSGGCMLVRREAFERADGFDVTFNPYGPEDLDLDLRLRKLGYTAVYVPAALVYHEHIPGHTDGGGMHSWAYIWRKARHWLILLHRHATPRELIFFYLIGAPLTAARAVRQRLGWTVTAPSFRSRDSQHPRPQ